MEREHSGHKIAARFYLSNKDNPVDPKHPLWNEPLPLSRKGEMAPGQQHSAIVLTYGEYFSAINTFFNGSQDCFLATTLPDFIQAPVSIDRPDHLSVYLEKHGAFYHPSRVVMPLENRSFEFMLNVAISTAGKRSLENEYNTLKKLENKYSYPFLPRVYACREIAVDGSRAVHMFLGEWFGAYCEFHVADGYDSRLSRIRVWDPDNEAVFLSRDQALSVYEQAAMILTACYDIESFEQISAWHHAAGDFVVSFDERQAPRVKLVTVRQYTPLFNDVEDSPEAVLNGLLLFLLKMSVCMRLDRLDGVGEISWVDDFAVQGVLTGFLKGLEIQMKNDRIPVGFIDYFKSFLIGIPAEEMADLFVAVADRVPSGSPDLPTINAHLIGHVDAFNRLVKTVW